MAGEIQITVVGNLVADPETRDVNGTTVANFTVAQTPRTFDKTRQEWVDGESVFLRCNIWREPAEHVVQSLNKGTRVVVVGRLLQRSFENKDGQKVTVMEIDVDEVGPSLRYATAQVHRTQASGTQQRNQQAARQQAPQQMPPRPGQQQPPQGRPSSNTPAYDPDIPW